ncbi:GDSL lipase/esterase [Dillenia turbinata]|uniref:GDSL lipase/esterase n=1 Tax=Dillenia turbinata TaxID=194707 RepID=A0AAN8Z7S0_9MAGN
MAKERPRTVTPFLCIVLIVVVAGAQESEPLTPAMFIFGDSLIDNGNNNFLATTARANYYPYGIDFGRPTGRFCNGRTVVDFGAQYLGLPLIPPYLGPTSRGSNILRGLNYASAAAGILDETGRTYGQRISFNGQISQFQQTVTLQLPSFFEDSSKLAQYLAKSVFLINIGGNDYINNYLQGNSYLSSHVYNGEAFADLLINTLSGQLARLYRLGARKMVLVGVGALGCIPSQLSTVSSGNGCVDQVNALANSFNTRLIKLTNTLNASLPGSFFIYQNIYDLFYDMINNPSTYGFSVPDKACCGNGKYGGQLTCLPMQQPCANRTQYIFWDSFHPTEAVNAIIAKRCYSPSATDCYPISIYQLAQL